MIKTSLRHVSIEHYQGTLSWNWSWQRNGSDCFLFTLVLTFLAWSVVGVVLFLCLCIFGSIIGNLSSFLSRNAFCWFSLILGSLSVRRIYISKPSNIQSLLSATQGLASASWHLVRWKFLVTDLGCLLSPSHNCVLLWVMELLLAHLAQHKDPQAPLSIS